MYPGNQYPPKKSCTCAQPKPYRDGDEVRCYGCGHPTPVQAGTRVRGV